MTRRLFLSLTGGGLVIGGSLVSQFDRVRQAVARARRPQLDRRLSPGRLSDSEMRTIVALAEVLIPADGASDKLKRIIESHVNHRTASVPGYLNEYRSAATLLDQTAKEVARNGAFADLDAPDRNKVVAAVLHNPGAETGPAQRLRRLFSTRSERAFRQFIVTDILTVFFQRMPDETWALVGYTRYPGVPRDPRSYASKPELAQR